MLNVNPSLLIVALFLFASASSHAASFDCTKAKSKVELAICSNPDLSKADQQMASAYNKSLSELPPEFAVNLRDDQRTWLQMRATVCTASSLAFPANEQMDQLQDCLKAEYRDRIGVLKNIRQQLDGILFFQVTKTMFAPDDTPGMDAEWRKNWPYGTLKANWSVSTDKSPEWQSWNKAIRAAMFRVLTPSLGQELKDWPQKWDGGMDVDLTARVESVNPQYVTSIIGNFWYGHGAAHENRNWMQFNWLRKEQREMRAGDVFKTDSGWEQKILEVSIQDLKSKLGADNSDFNDMNAYKKTVDEYIVNPQNWTLKKEGLTFDWQPYAVACFACTPDSTTISWTDLKDYLNPTFQIPK